MIVFLAVIVVVLLLFLSAYLAVETTSGVGFMLWLIVQFLIGGFSVIGIVACC